MAARLAGRDPDQHLTLKLADMVPFDGPMWSYPDFLARAEAAYDALTGPNLRLPSKLNGHEHPAVAVVAGRQVEEGASRVDR
jgi:hypothetical protein